MRFYSLAYSFSEGGICIAGVQPDGTWIRPIRADGSGWSPSVLHARGFSERDVQDVQLPDGIPSPNGRYIEDVRLRDSDVLQAKTSTPGPDRRRRILMQTTEQIALFAHTRSLGLARPIELNFWADGTNSYGFRYRSLIVDRSRQMYARVTVPWLVSWLNDNVGDKAINRAQLLERMSATNVFVTLSWGKPWAVTGRVYLLLAGIHFI